MIRPALASPKDFYAPSYPAHGPPTDRRPRQLRSRLPRRQGLQHLLGYLQGRLRGHRHRRPQGHLQRPAQEDRPERVPPRLLPGLPQQDQPHRQGGRLGRGPSEGRPRLLREDPLRRPQGRRAAEDRQHHQGRPAHRDPGESQARRLHHDPGRIQLRQGEGLPREAGRPEDHLCRHRLPPRPGQEHRPLGHPHGRRLRQAQGGRGLRLLLQEAGRPHRREGEVPDLQARHLPVAQPGRQRARRHLLHRQPRRDHHRHRRHQHRRQPPVRRGGRAHPRAGHRLQPPEHHRHRR